MLERLRITDLAIVERAEIALGPGWNVVTGETGAGKSLLVEAVELLLGGRADSDLIREGARAAVVDGEFRLAGAVSGAVAKRLADWGIEFDGETLIVRREVQAGGRSRATVNQSPVTLAALKQLAESLVDLHGQHEHQSLLRAEAGIDTLDRLAGLEADRERYGEKLATLRVAEAEHARLEQSLSTHADRRAWMEEATREIGAVRLEEGEEERLKADASRLAHADRLRELVARTLENLADDDLSATARLGAAHHAIEQAAALDPTLVEHLPALDEARIAATEAARALAEYAARLESDPMALEAIEERREAIARLGRKYRRTVSELIAWRAELDSELALGEDAGATLARAREAAGEARRRCVQEGHALSKRRRAAAKEWSTKLTRELRPLGFPDAAIAFAVDPGPAGEPELLERGIDSVEIRFSPNVGEPPRPLQKIASGGELSRVMLALKSALETQDSVDVLIFDEVDSGIGGTVAQAVGERLRQLARHRQLVCVTHLPMIAALAPTHICVAKHVRDGRTVAAIERLEGDARIDELARMLAGSRASETTRRQARELLRTG